MDTELQLQKRRVIPNWRYFYSTLQLGELNSNSSRLAENIYPIDDYIDDWIGSKTIHGASDLISAAITNSQRNNPYVIDAAKYLLSKNQEANLIQRNIAKLIIEENNPAQQSSIRKLKYDALERLKKISDIRKDIHNFRMLAIVYPYNPIVYVDMARAYVTIGLNEKAEKLFKIALSLDPHNRFVARSASRFFIHYGKMDEAAEVIRKTGYTRYDPWLMASDISIASLRGKTSNNIKKGLQMIQSSSFTNFSLTELSSAIGTIELESGAHKRSRDLFKKSMIDPNDNSLAQAEWARQYGANINITLKKNVKCDHEVQVYKAILDNDEKGAMSHIIDWICDMPFALKPIQIGYELSTNYIRDYELSSVILEVGLKSHTHSSDDLQNNKVYSWMLNNKAYVDARRGHIDVADKELKELEQIMQDVDLSTRICATATRGLIYFRRKCPEQGRSKYKEALNMIENLLDKNEETFIKAKINLIREELIYCNFNDESLKKQIIELNIPDKYQALQNLKKEITDEIMRMTITGEETTKLQ